MRQRESKPFDLDHWRRDTDEKLNALLEATLKIGERQKVAEAERDQARLERDEAIGAHAGLKMAHERALDDAIAMYNAELARLFGLLDGPPDVNSLQRELVQARRGQRTAEAEVRALRHQLAERDAR